MDEEVGGGVEPGQLAVGHITEETGLRQVLPRVTLEGAPLRPVAGESEKRPGRRARGKRAKHIPGGLARPVFGDTEHHRAGGRQAPMLLRHPPLFGAEP